ncbi:MAG: glycosyltransferase family A protein [Alphaproteobacteria bacterium]
MADSPLVTCAIPVFNGARFLKQAVESVTRQTYSNIEIIVVNDGSTDETPKIIESLGPVVRSFRQENKGPAAARNVAIREARGEFVAFLDADDLWVPDKIEKQIACFERDPDLAICTAQAEHFWEGEVADEEQQLRDSLNAPHDAGWFFSSVIRRDLFDRIGVFDESLWHLDAAEIAMRIRAEGAKLQVIPDALMRRRLHADNLSRNRTTEADERLYIIKARLQRARQAPPT